LFVSEAVDEFDLSEIFEYYERSDRGYSPYHPTMMVKVKTAMWINEGKCLLNVEKRLDKSLPPAYEALKRLCEH